MCRQLDAMDREEVTLQAEVPMGKKAWHLQMQETRLKVRGRVGRVMASLQVYRGYRVTMHSRHRGDTCFFIHLILPGNTKATMSQNPPSRLTTASLGGNTRTPHRPVLLPVTVVRVTSQGRMRGWAQL